MFKNKDLYLAPEIFERGPLLMKQKTSLVFDEHKLDAFSLGMTLLYAGCGHSVQDCYDKKNFKFIPAALQKHLSEFKAKFQVNPMLTEALEKLLDFDCQNRASVVELQSELPKIDEINSYFEVIEENTQGDYHLKYPVSAEDMRAAEMAKKTLIAKNKFYQAPVGNVEKYNAGAAAINVQNNTGRPGPTNTNQGAAVQGYPQNGGLNQSGLQGQNQAGAANKGLAETTYAREIGGMTTLPQGSMGYQPGPSNAPMKPGVVAGGPTNINRGMGSYNQSNPNLVQPGGSALNQGGQSSPISMAFNSMAPNKTAVGNAQSPAFQNTPTWQNSSGVQANNQYNPQASGISFNGKQNAGNPLDFSYPGIRKPAPGLASTTNVNPQHISFIQSSNGAQNQKPVETSAQTPVGDAGSRLPGPVMASHTIFNKPATIIPQEYKPLVSTSIGSAMKRSASQPTRIGLEGSQYTVATPQRTYAAPPVSVNTVQHAPISSHRQISYSHAALPRPGESIPLAGGIRTSEVSYHSVAAAPLVVTKPSYTSMSATPSRLRSSSHNIVRNGIIVDQDNPSQEMRASRIVISRDKVDFHVENDELIRKVAPNQFSQSHRVVHQAAPFITSHLPTTTYAQPFAGRISQFASTGVISHQPALTGHSYIAAPRVYSSGTPVRHAGIPMTTGSASRVLHNIPTGGITYGALGGAYATTTPRRVVQNGAVSYTTPRQINRLDKPVLAEAVPAIRQSGIRAETPVRNQEILESTYIPKETKDEKIKEDVQKKEDSDIKPRELERGETEGNKTHNIEETNEQIEPAWEE
jgi:hypothetical protein